MNQFLKINCFLSILTYRHLVCSVALEKSNTDSNASINHYKLLSLPRDEQKKGKETSKEKGQSKPDTHLCFDLSLLNNEWIMYLSNILSNLMF